MKRFVFAFAALAAVFVAASSQEAITLKAFRGIEVDGRIQVMVEFKEEYTIRFASGKTDSTCVSRIIENGILKIGVKGGGKCKGDITAVITCPSITSIAASSRADITVPGLIKGEKLKLEVKSNARVTADMDIKHLEAGLSTGGVFSGKGYAVNQKIDVSTNSTFSAYDIEGEQVEVNSQSGSVVKVHATKVLNATAGAGGYIGYKGNPGKSDLDPGANGKIEKSED